MPKYLPKRLFFILGSLKKRALKKVTPDSEEGDLDTLEGFVPVDDSLGVIQHIALSFYSGHDEDLRNSYNKLYSDLIMKLVRGSLGKKGELEISVIVPKKSTLKIVKQVNHAINTLAQFTGSFINKKSLATYNILEANRSGLPMWIQDYFITLQNHDDKQSDIRLIEDKKRSRSNNDQANSLDKHLTQKYAGDQSRLFKSSLNFKGGNILFIGKYALIGRDNLKGSNEADFAKQFQKLTHISPKNIIWLGNDKSIPEPNLRDIWARESFNWIDLDSCQPIYHLDLFITPAGKDEFGRYRLLIGDPIYDGDQNLPIYKYTATQIETIVSQLERYTDLVIYRNPLPLSYVDSFDEDDKKKRIWFFASYNNCLVQWDTSPGNCCVWLPTYGTDFSNERSGYEEVDTEEAKYGGNWLELKEFDLANQKIWRNLGFRVIQLTNYIPLALNRGAVHCITKVLYRNKPEKNNSFT